MALDSVRQPIIRGIQAVGSVQLLYRYNKFTDTTNSAWELPVPSSFKLTNTTVDPCVKGGGTPQA